MKNGPLPQLRDLADTKASGELVCEVGGAEIHVYLQGGRIAWATDSRNPLAFKQYLKEHARLDDESYEEAMAECRHSHAPIGETLVAWKLATPEQVRGALGHQIGLALAMLEQCSISGKSLFLPRPYYSQYSVDYTFEVGELLSAPRTVVPGSSAAVAPPEPFEADRRGSIPPPPSTDAPKRPAAPPGPPAAPPPLPPSGSSSSRRVVLVVVVALLAAAAVVVGVVRSSRPSPDKLPPAPAEAAVPAAAPSPGATVPAEPELVFGMSSPFSGAVKEMGRAMRVGVEAAFAVANEGGGVNGRKLRLVALDDRYDPTRTLQVMRDLVETRKVFGIVGNGGTPTAAVSLPYVMEKKVLFFGALTGAPFLRKSPPDRYVFNYRPSYAEETAVAFSYLTEVRRIPVSQIASFCQDDAFGAAGFAGVEAELRKLKRDPAKMVRTTYKRNSADVSQAVARIKRERPRIRAVVMVSTYQAAIQFIQQVKDLGLSPVFTNVSAVNANVLAEGLVAAGKGYTKDVVVTQTVPLPTSKATAALEYQAALEKYAVGEKPDYVSFEGFLVGKILVEGLRRAGKELDTESVVSALEGLSGLEMGIGTPIGFAAADHQGSHKVWGTMLEPDGSYRPIKLE